jgi:pantoate--beta-alanine ligase
MGALHDGHLALVREARKHAQKVIVSVFVNPTQFGPGEDFTRYPRDLEGDLGKCASAGADVVFSPSDPSILYPVGEETRVRVGDTAKHLEGAFRPTHFEGVATVCTKLFLAIGPCVAVFGRKDYQQLAVIRRVVSDLFLPVEVIGLATVREADGLAMSSRNAYLSPEDRLRARCISRGLDAAIVAFEEGAREVATLESMARAQIEPSVDSIDYITIADADSVVPLGSSAVVGERALLAIAANLGKTRLIDNVVLGGERGVADRVAAFNGRVK